jgi:hypothetical protein
MQKHAVFETTYSLQINISILLQITYEFRRLPGKYILFFDKKKSDIPNFFLNHKQRGY